MEQDDSTSKKPFWRSRNNGKRQQNKRLPDESKPSGQGQLKPNAGFRASVGPRKLTDEELAKIKPTHLSTKTNDRNDPMIRNGFLLVGDCSMTPSSKIPGFSLDYSQYITLARTSYNSLCRVDRGFGKTISEGMYLYYAVICLWRRIYHVISSRGELVTYAAELDTIFNYCKVQVPKDLVIYLQGIGNISDFSDRKAELKIQGRCEPIKVLDSFGSFGKVTSSNHNIYETLPSPLVCLLRINEDIRSTISNRVSADWDLPENIRPGSNLKPTVNLLGWSRSRPLTPEQLRELQGCGFALDSALGVTKHVDNIPIHYPLLQVVGESLAKAKAAVSVPETSQYEGSLSQVLYGVQTGDRIYDQFAIGTSRFASMKSYCQTSGNISCGAIAFRYRFKREDSVGAVNHLSYISQRPTTTGELLDPGPPSAEWLETQNTVFESVPEIWNIDRFTTSIAYGLDTAQAVSDSYLNR